MRVSLDITDTLAKATKHHFVGFYGDKFPLISRKPEYVNILETLFKVSADLIVNFSYDGKDCLLQPQFYIVSPTDLPYGTLVKTLEGVTMGCITNRMEPDKYPIPLGTSTDLLFLSGIEKMSIKIKDHPIAYADKLFTSKEDLQAFLIQDRSSTLRQLIVYRTLNGSETQVILHEDERNILSCHLRYPLIDNYRFRSLAKSSIPLYDY
ncbi:hypothetical protein [Agrotis ipsilon virus]|nr:hypothetical protein [Agrotis ipsilon virus]